MSVFRLKKNHFMDVCEIKHLNVFTNKFMDFCDSKRTPLEDDHRVVETQRELLAENSKFARSVYLGIINKSKELYQIYCFIVLVRTMMEHKCQRLS